MVHEAVDAGFSIAGQLLLKVYMSNVSMIYRNWEQGRPTNPLPNGGTRVVVCALLWRMRRSQHVANQGRVTNFLVSHKFNEEAVLSSKASSFEIGNGELGKAPVKQVELDPFLVQGQGQRLVIEVRLRDVLGRSTVGAKSAVWHVRRWLVAVQLRPWELALSRLLFLETVGIRTWPSEG